MLLSIVFSRRVSIPEGAIEGNQQRNLGCNPKQFQYPKVRLKGSWRDKTHSPPRVSIPEGAIEGARGGVQILEAKRFQYPKVRLKVLLSAMY